MTNTAFTQQLLAKRDVFQRAVLQFSKKNRGVVRAACKEAVARNFPGNSLQLQLMRDIVVKVILNKKPPSQATLDIINNATQEKHTNAMQSSTQPYLPGLALGMLTMFVAALALASPVSAVQLQSASSAVASANDVVLYTEQHMMQYAGLFGLPLTEDQLMERMDELYNQGRFNIVHMDKYYSHMVESASGLSNDDYNHPDKVDAILAKREAEQELVRSNPALYAQGILKEEIMKIYRTATPQQKVNIGIYLMEHPSVGFNIYLSYNPAVMGMALPISSGGRYNVIQAYFTAGNSSTTNPERGKITLRLDPKAEKRYTLTQTLRHELKHATDHTKHDVLGLTETSLGVQPYLDEDDKKIIVDAIDGCMQLIQIMYSKLTGKAEFSGSFFSHENNDKACNVALYNENCPDTPVNNEEANNAMVRLTYSLARTFSYVLPVLAHRGDEEYWKEAAAELQVGPNALPCPEICATLEAANVHQTARFLERLAVERSVQQQGSVQHTEL